MPQRDITQRNPQGQNYGSEGYRFESCRVRHSAQVGSRFTGWTPRESLPVNHGPAMTDHHHNVYVILLDDAVARHPSVRRLNPKRVPARPCVYVGMTGLPVEHRFENHKHGYKSAWTVRKYGIRLLPELYEHLNPMPFEAAAQMERDLAEDLRAQGYTVAGGT
jgi:hypothetical protein